MIRKCVEEFRKLEKIWAFEFFKANHSHIEIARNSSRLVKDTVFLWTRSWYLVQEPFGSFTVRMDSLKERKNSYFRDVFEISLPKKFTIIEVLKFLSMRISSCFTLYAKISRLNEIVVLCWRWIWNSMHMNIRWLSREIKIDVALLRLVLSSEHPYNWFCVS